MRRFPLYALLACAPVVAAAGDEAGHFYFGPEFGGITASGDRDTAVGLYPSAGRVGDWLWGARQAGTGLLYGLADTPEGAPIYGYDLNVAADTASNVLAVNALNRIAQLADVAGDASGAALMRARAGQLAGECARPT